MLQLSQNMEESLLYAGDSEAFCDISVTGALIPSLVADYQLPQINMPAAASNPSMTLSTTIQAPHTLKFCTLGSSTPNEAAECHIETHIKV